MDAPRRYFALANEESFDELIALFTPDAVLLAPGTKPRQGEAAIREYYEKAFAPYPEHCDEPTRFIEAGATVVAEIHFKGKLATGGEIEFDAVDVFDLTEDGRIARLSSWYDSHYARQLIREASD